MKQAYAAACAAFLAAASPALANDDAMIVRAWTLSGEFKGKFDSDNTLRKKAGEDLSGAACTTMALKAPLCVGVDDEMQGLNLLSLDNGRIAVGPFVRLADPSTGAGKDRRYAELDLEGVAYDPSTRHFYAVGSHGAARNPDGKPPEERAARFAAASWLFRIPVRADGAGLDIAIPANPATIAPGIASTARLLEAFRATPELAPHVGEALEKAPGGLNIEGLAVKDGRLFAGLRAPSIGGKAMIAETALEPLFGQGALPATVVHTVDVGDGRGVRDLAMIDGGILVLAGPETDLVAEAEPALASIEKDGEFVLALYDPVTKARTGFWTLKAVATECDEEKAETIIPLSRQGRTLNLLLLHEGGKDKCAQEVSIELPG
jgi:Protein of unknown function (DUF3616)